VLEINPLLKGLLAGGLLGGGTYATARLIDALSGKLSPHEKDIPEEIPVFTRELGEEEEEKAAASKEFPGFWKSLSYGLGGVAGTAAGFTLLRKMLAVREKNQLIEDIENKQIEIAKRIGALPQSSVLGEEEETGVEKLSSYDCLLEKSAEALADYVLFEKAAQSAPRREALIKAILKAVPSRFKGKAEGALTSELIGSRPAIPRMTAGHGGGGPVTSGSNILGEETPLRRLGAYATGGALGGVDLSDDGAIPHVDPLGALIGALGFRGAQGIRRSSANRLGRISPAAHGGAGALGVASIIPRATVNTGKSVLDAVNSGSGVDWSRWLDYLKKYQGLAIGGALGAGALGSYGLLNYLYGKEDSKPEIISRVRLRRRAPR